MNRSAAIIHLSLAASLATVASAQTVNITGTEGPDSVRFVVAYEQVKSNKGKQHTLRVEYMAAGSGKWVSVRDSNNTDLWDQNKPLPAFDLTLLGGNDSVWIEVKTSGERLKAPVTVNLGQGDDIADFSLSTVPVSLAGGKGNDRLVGGTGADTLVGGMGSDTLDPGLGSDLVDVSIVDGSTDLVLARYGGSDLIFIPANAAEASRETVQKDSSDSVVSK